MHHAIVFIYFVSGTQASDILNMSHFHKIFMTKYNHTEPTEKLFSFPVSDGQTRHIAAQNMPNIINKCQTTFFSANNTKNGQKHAKLWRTCKTTFSHAKPLFRTNFRNFALKMSTWQHWCFVWKLVLCRDCVTGAGASCHVSLPLFQTVVFFS